MKVLGWVWLRRILHAKRRLGKPSKGIKIDRRKIENVRIEGSKAGTREGKEGEICW